MKCTQVLLLVLALTALASAQSECALGGVMFGSFIERPTTYVQAANDIRQANDFRSTEDQNFINSILKGSQLKYHSVKKAAREIKLYLLQTWRGLECFTISDKCSAGQILSNYARGSDEQEVLDRCKNAPSGTSKEIMERLKMN